MAEDCKRKREDGSSSENEVPLHYILEEFFRDYEFISRDKLRTLFVQATKTVPISLMGTWRRLRQLIEAWDEFQVQVLPNQKRHEVECDKVYNPLHTGHCSYSQFLSDEKSRAVSLSPEKAERLRTFVTKLLSDSSSERSMQSQQSLVTAGTAFADLLSLASCEDHTARLFGLQTP